jgi:hypothetical protein
MKPLTQRRVLALDLRPLRFGFAVFEGPDELLDWGIKNFRHGVNAVKVPMKVKLALLIEEHHPDVLVIRPPMTSRHKRIVRTIAALANARRIPIQMIPGVSVRRAFHDDNHNKYKIATAVAARYPELAPRLGPERKRWQAEPYAMGIFDAAALGVAYFAHRTTKKSDSGHRAIWPVPR